MDALILNAGVGVCGDFVRENKLEAELNLIGLNINSLVHLAKHVLPAMVARGQGRVLITSSIAALMPVATDAEFFARSGMEDTKVAQGEKDDPARIAQQAYDAMLKGEDRGARIVIPRAGAAPAVRPAKGAARAHCRL